MSAVDRISTNRAFANVGKAIAACERTLLPTASRFDDYVSAVAAADAQLQEGLFSNDEARGLRLFIGEAQCTRCHNGPLLTNNEFHNTGVLSARAELPDRGRADGVREVQAEPFNCRGDYSDDAEHRCPELDYVRTGPELIGAFRTPSLRNVELTAPYMHKGQMASIEEVLAHYNEAPDAMIGHNETEPLRLGSRQLRQLAAFLRTLTSPAPYE
jgi:cytochrome c peroxidase